MRVLLIVCSFVVVASVAASVVRVARGPTTLDRLLAGSYALASSVALLLFIGFLFERPAMFADIGLAYALVAFLFPLSVARFLEARGTGTGGTGTDSTGTDNTGTDSTGTGSTGSDSTGSDSTGSDSTGSREAET